MAEVLIYGRGKSGNGAAKLLEELGVDYDIIDDNSGEEVFDGVTQMIISPGIATDNPLVLTAKTKGIEVIGEIELGYRHCLADVIAVTGTNGKTTTVELITELLKKSYIDAYALGNIGNSFAEQALNLKLSDVAVLELSSFQLESIASFCPKIALCLNITPDHLERHKTMDNYITTKRRMFLNQTQKDYAVLNYDDEIVRNFNSSIHSDKFYFSLKSVVRGSYIVGNSIYFKDDSIEFVCGLDSVKLSGEHNLLNALAAVTVAKILNISNSVIEKVLAEFTPPPNRIQYIKTINGVKYFNDSKATNIEATMCACHAMRGKTVLLMGGYDKGLDYKDFFNRIPLKIGTIVCYGANRKQLAEQSAHICGLTVIEVEDLAEAVLIASHVRADNVLLSPATSSYDAYKNYEERGKHFIELVNNLEHN